MATRVGIELSPAACRIVEIDAGPAWRRNARDTRVLSFAVLPPSGPETQAKLESLRRRRAAVVVWEGPSVHRQVMVAAGSYESMRAEALAALGAAGVQTRGMWADIAPARRADDGRGRRPVIVALAPAAMMRPALERLLDAGIRVRTVMTPAAALGSLARLRRSLGVPGAIEAYVALEETATSIALVRDGVLMAARDLAWGFLDEYGDGRQPRRREDIATRLADELGEFLAGIDSTDAVGQVCICGGLDELRSMTAPLMERLDVEVETLDSLFGIDATRLPEPGDEFRECSAELRLAWAAAADWPPPLNLLRARRRQESKARLGRAAVVAGVAAGLGVGWAVERSHLWRSTEPAPVTRTAVNAPPAASPRTRTAPSTRSAQPPAVPTPVSSPVVASKPAPAAVPPPVVASKPAPATVAPPVASSRPPVASGPAATVNRPPIGPPPPVVPRVAEPAMQAAVARAGEAPPATKPAETPAVATRPTPARVTPARPARPEPPRAVAKAPAPEAEVALPFDAVLGTILYSADRRLAIIDGRIVGLGDEVRGAHVIDITPGAVLLRDGQGRLRRLTLGAGGR